MKHERLIALLFTLQARRSGTAAELAAVLEVSERTVLRDVAALQAAGVPVWSEPGRGGGIRLLDGWRTRLDGLTGTEAAALFLGDVPTALADLGLAGAFLSAQSKLLATLPEPARERATQLAERFHLDAPGWFHRQEELPHLAEVAAAVWRRQRLLIGYRRGDGTVERTLDPLGLVLKAGIWYAVGAVGDAVRSYRISRITAARPTGQTFDRPAGFRLAEHWRRSSAEFDRSMLRERIRIRIPAGAAGALRAHADASAAAQALAAAGPPDAEGWLELDLAVESIRVAQDQLTALGGAVEVLEPPQLRAALAQVGARMAARNGGAPVSGTSRRQ